MSGCQLPRFRATEGVITAAEFAHHLQLRHLADALMQVDLPLSHLYS